MRKKYQLLIAMVFSMFFLSSCWSSTELNELAIAVGIGIDKVDDGYMVSVQLVNPGELAGNTRSGRSEVLTARMKGETVFEALRKLTTISPRKIYVAHILQVIFGEEMAKEGIAEPLEFFIRDHEVRPNFFLGVAKGNTAFNILRVQTSLESIPSGEIFQILENSEKNWAVTKTVKLDELMLNILSKGKEPVLTGIHLVGDPNKGSKLSSVQKSTLDATLSVGEIAVLKKDRLIGWLNSEESKGYNFITDNVQNSITTMPYNEGKITLETIRSKTEVKSIVKEGKPKIHIFVSLESNIGEVLTNVNIMEEKTITNIEKKYKQYVEEKINESMHRVQQDFDSDIFGFGDVIHRDSPKEWKKLEPNWDEHFKNLDVFVHVEAHIKKIGKINNSLINNLNEE